MLALSWEPLQWLCIYVYSYSFIVFYIKTHDSKSRGQEEPATTEWVIYKEHRQKTRKCSSQALAPSYHSPKYVLTT